MMLFKERIQREGWMAVGVCFLACLHITSAWSAFRTLTHQQNDIHKTTQENEQDKKSDNLVLDIEGEGPLSETQILILQTLLRRYIENGQESPEDMLSVLISQIEKRVSSNQNKGRKQKGHRKNRSSGNNQQTTYNTRQTTQAPRTTAAPATTPSPTNDSGSCTFVVNIPVTYDGTCTTVGNGIPACDFPGNSSHPDSYMYLWSYDCYN